MLCLRSSLFLGQSSPSDQEDTCKEGPLPSCQHWDSTNCPTCSGSPYVLVGLQGDFITTNPQIQITSFLLQLVIPRSLLKTLPSCQFGLKFYFLGHPACDSGTLTGLLGQNGRDKPISNGWHSSKYERCECRINSRGKVENILRSFILFFQSHEPVRDTNRNISLFQHLNYR